VPAALHELTAVELVGRLGRRDLTAEALVRALLERIDEREPVVQAWTCIRREALIRSAQDFDRGAIRGPLHGLPFGVKDVFDTCDLPTEYGSPIYKGHQPTVDAAVVSFTRSAGGLIFGKAVTTEFATFPPGKTRNPHNPEHTPGGSSSGSAAAVADSMVPVAFGTQTVGSTIRPASFCGTVGYKPTYALLPTTGVKAISYCLDTVGLFTKTVADLGLITGALSGRPLAVPGEQAAPRIGLCLTPQWQYAQPEVQDLFGRLGAEMSRAGAQVTDFTLPGPYEKMHDAQAVIWDYEVARCLTGEYATHPDKIREPLRGQIERGLALPVADYDAAMAIAREGRRGFDSVMKGFDVLVVPSSAGEAPKGDATGLPYFNRAWSLLHTPAVHVPYGHGPNRLPIGFQVVGRIGDDARTLACAHWLQVNVASTRKT
jgi:Asp-tRNA(Asn)/Glu-tRNA(Gln) amidotransferase A subunit family amidase